MEGGAGYNGLRAKVGHLEQRQQEDRRSQERIAENGATTARTLAVIVEQVGQLQKDHQLDRERHEREHQEQWKAIDKGREWAVRVFLILLAAAVSYAVAAGGPPSP